MKRLISQKIMNWAKSLKPVVEKEGNNIHIFSNLEVDGNIKGLKNNVTASIKIKDSMYLEADELYYFNARNYFNNNDVVDLIFYFDSLSHNAPIRIDIGDYIIVSNTNVDNDYIVGGGWGLSFEDGCYIDLSKSAFSGGLHLSQIGNVVFLSYARFEIWED